MFFNYIFFIVATLFSTQISIAKQYLLDDLFDSMKDFKHTVEQQVGLSPKNGFHEDEKNFIIEVAVPGLTKEDIKIVVDSPDIEPMVTISAEVHKEEIKGNESSATRMQSVSQESFVVRFKLTQPVKVEEIKSDLKNGILTLRLPKEKPVKRKSHIISVE